ncbi:MAG: hypothetical protein JNL32_12620 [Candidatus Kapabacteria bacterium]|nr:hypothetical protein [Candidatus Kapabacteria bacterium]
MKHLLVCMIAALGVIAFVPQVHAQTDYTPDSLTVLREKFNKPFPTVWKTIKKLLTERGCALEMEKQNFDEKTETYKGNIRSEACVLVSGEDSTRDVLLLYGKVPMIRGGVWVSGRVQYNFSIKDMPDKTVQVVLTAEVSGKEDFITHLVHFWNSNGILETKLMEDLKKALAATGEKK